MSSRSAKVCARITPTCLNSASYMRSAPASAPVCDTAERAPDSERPILNATTGLPARAALSARRAKLLRMPYCLDVQRDDRGGLVVDEVIDEVGQLQVDFVAGRNQLGQSDAARGSARQQRAQNAAALRDDPDVAGRKLVHLQRTAGRQHDVVGEVDESDGVRAQDAHLARGFDQLPLPPTAFVARLGVATGEHDRRGGAARGQLAHRDVRALGAEQHDPDVGGGGQRADVGVARQVADVRRHGD